MRFSRICSTFIMTVWFKTILIQSIFISKFQLIHRLLRIKTLLLTLDSILKAVLTLAFTHFWPHCSYLTIISVRIEKYLSTCSVRCCCWYQTTPCALRGARTHTGLPLFISLGVANSQSKSFTNKVAKILILLSCLNI